jgi:Fe-S cluster assembly protein SufD
MTHPASVSPFNADTYLDSLLRGHSSLPRSARGWLNTLRADALERANALSVPSTRDEEWRYTDLSPLYQTSFQRADAPGQLPLEAISRFEVPEAAHRLTFVDGHFVASLSSVSSAAGYSVRPLSAALGEQDPVLEQHLARYAPLGDDPFTALNTAWLHEGAVLHVRRNVAVDAPIHLLFLSTRAEVASYPRLLVIAESGSDCTLIEDYVAHHAGSYLVNGLAEIGVGTGARVRHLRVQRESLEAFQIATCAVRLERDARYLTTSVALGARLSRLNLNVMHAGEGTECEADGLAFIGGRQLADTHSLLDHTVPHGRSRQLHKCIVDGTARAVFNGKIFVRAGAQRTDATQESRNLLLSARAQVDTKPQLEIFADDVKCAHGAAVGQLDADQMFYLKSRGLDEATARDLLTFAFAAELVHRIPVPSLARGLEQTIMRQTQNRNIR